MKYYLITYDHIHRKTQDLLFRFLMNNIRPSIITLPWKDRKPIVPLFKCKPDPLPHTPGQLARAFELDIRPLIPEQEKSDNIYIIGGAGILPEKFIKNNIVINSHPGWLPAVRGLDALKWAIYFGEQIGVTTHVVDETVDGGLLIERRECPLYSTDCFYELAMRLYSMEIDMLVDAVISGKYKDARPFTDPPNPPNKRMTKKNELQMIQRFESIKIWNNYSGGKEDISCISPYC